MKKIIISGEIGWDVYPDDIREQLKAANGDDLDVHVASPGGSVFKGIEIYNLFRDYKRDYPNSQNMATIKSLAASMGAYLIVNPVFDLVVAEDNAVFMIHNASGFTSGDYREMKLFSEILEGLTKIIATALAAKVKKSLSEMRESMDAESWYFGDEILEAGFVDEMIPSEEKKDKPAALAQAKIAFKAVSEKMNEVDQKQEIQKIAAMIQPDITGQDQNIAQTPADAGNNITEVKSMNLNELMAENPAANIELKEKLDEQFKAGEVEGRESLQETIKTAAKFLAPDSVYPATIKSLAVDVLNGEKTAEALETTVSAFDAFLEANKSEEAKTEAEKTGETPGEISPELSEDGIIKNEADFNAEVKRSKIAHGMEV